jgi:hypothetical protein
MAFQNTNLVFCLTQGLKQAVTQAGLELLILLPQPPEYWDYRQVPSLQFTATILTGGLQL